MKSVCVYFQAHQPFRLNEFSFFDLGSNKSYFDDDLNIGILNKVSDKCYLPANRLFLGLIRLCKGRFKLSYSISGVLLEQLEQHRPDVIESFKALVDTGCVEILAENYYHSLASVYDEKEFLFQVNKHQQTIKRLFETESSTFRNTELIFNSSIAKTIRDLGFKSVLAEGFFQNEEQHNSVVELSGAKGLSVGLRNYTLSDDIAFRFSEQLWAGKKLSARRFITKVMESKDDVVNLFMDYESIGEHHWRDTGIFDFWKEFVQQGVKRGLSFITPSDYSAFQKSDYKLSNTTSWADKERDLSAWDGNTMQKEALKKCYSFSRLIADNSSFVELWRKLQTSDHFYYMSTKGMDDGNVHDYFSPYNSPHDAYLNYMNVLSDFELRLKDLK